MLNPRVCLYGYSDSSTRISLKNHPLVACLPPKKNNFILNLELLSISSTFSLTFQYFLNKSSCQSTSNKRLENFFHFSIFTNTKENFHNFFSLIKFNQ